MTIYIVGNPSVPDDSVPNTLAERLRETFPDIPVIETDPNENFIPAPGSAIIDTVEGIEHVETFRDIDAFVTTKSVTPHDYDLGFHLQLLRKLGRLPRIAIVGIPRHITAKQAWKNVRKELFSLVNEGKDQRQK